MKTSMTCSLKALAAGACVAALSAGCGGGAGGDGGAAELQARAKAAAEAALFKPPEGGSGELHVYTWSDYIAPDVIKAFEDALSCKVVIDTFDSNEAMYAKLKAGGAGYDVIMPSSYQIATMAKEGMIVKIDRKRIPWVVANFDKSFESQILDPSFAWNVPYAVTYTGFAYRKDKLPAGASPDTWAILGNPALKGRITLLDDIREVIGAGLMYLGYSVNSTDPAQIDAAVAKVLEWRPNIRKFDAESYKTEVASGATYLGHGYSTDVTQVIVGDEEAGAPARDDVGFALPKEGFSIAFDEMVLAKGSKNPGLAYAFMNYLYDGEVAKVNMEYICGPCPSKPGIDALDEEYRAQIVLSGELLSRGQVIHGFADDLAAMELYNKAWDRIKATSPAKK